MKLNHTYWCTSTDGAPSWDRWDVTVAYYKELCSLHPAYAKHNEYESVYRCVDWEDEVPHFKYACLKCLHKQLDGIMLRTDDGDEDYFFLRGHWR